MKQKTTHYIYIFFFLLPFKGIIGQNFTLKLSSVNKNEITVLDKINYTKSHKDTINLNIEIDRVSIYLKSLGYFTNSVDSIKKNNTEYTAYFSLNVKIKSAIIKIPSDSKFLFENFNMNNNIVSIPIKKLQTTLSNISKTLDKQGKSFSKVQLKNILIRDKTLFADLNINQSKKRTINKVIIRGYENFPKSYLKNYYNIKQNTIFNQEKIKDISLYSKSLQFISEIKPPEVLFTKDSTLLYIYLKKKQNNSFDGIVNFASKENGGLLFNGNIDLKLNNILNTGERFELFWNSIGKERQEFKILTEIPYLFNSAITPEFSFSLYKQDSTFINSRFDTKIKYNINQNIKVGLSYSSEDSKKLSEININNNLNTFTNNFIGIILSYTKPKNDIFFNDKFNMEINPFLGKRKNKNNTTNQFKLKAIASYIWDLSKRNSIYIKNETGFLNSDTYLNNELFRIGGANSIRGFNEQSIFTQNYTFFNIEYRYLTSDKSYLYTITDIGQIKEENNKLLSFGFGYLFKTNNSQININTTIEKNSQKPINFNNTKLIISWKNVF